MKIEKHEEALKEVYETIDQALSDPKGLLGHQRRIASMMSMGMQQAIELYFHKLHIIKPGTQLKHEWFKLDEKNIINKILPVLTKKLEEIPKINEILFLARKIESENNYQIGFCDCLHIAIAKRLDATLVTRDKDLIIIGRRYVYVDKPENLIC